MLSRLAIRDIVLIERLDIDFQPGLSVLTGETGAGKSILLDALALALGARGDPRLVRQGATQGQVTAAFDIAHDHPARSLIADNGLDCDGDVILRRVQVSDGRTRAFVNDQPASVALLRDIAGTLVEIHGQHDDRALVDPASHRALVDAFGGLQGEAAAVATAHRTWRQADRELDEARAQVAAAAREADFLRTAVRELAELDPEPGEEATLAEQRAAMMRAERVASDIAEAADALGGSSSPVPTLASLLRRLERKAAEAPGLLEDANRALDEALIALDAARVGIEAALRATEHDPRLLERTEERLFALRAAARKHNTAADDLAALAVRMADDLAALEAGEERIGALEQQAGAARSAYARAAAALTDHRTRAARDLEVAVMGELPALKLERAAFFVSIATDQGRGTENGFDMIEFHVRTNPGAHPGPLMKVASGGELARFMLALKVALADRGSAPVLVFDEIDSGAGGAVADAIGQRLARLAARVQVLCVTHAPQVAARATDHFVIVKTPHGTDAVHTSINRMDESGRAEEIARMLAGATITDEARRAAERLLADRG